MDSKKDSAKKQQPAHDVTDGDAARERLIDKPNFREGHPEERERLERVSRDEHDLALETQDAGPVVQPLVNPVSTEVRAGGNQPAAPQQAVVKEAFAEREPNQDAPPPRHHQPGRDHLKGRRVGPQ